MQGVPTGVNLNRYSGSGSCIPWHSDNESLFAPPNQPKLIVSMGLGHSVVFQVRRAPGDVPSSITLDHGDFLVMDGSAQLEYAHRTAGVVSCVLPTCMQGLAEPDSRGLGIEENKLSSSWGLVFFLLILVSFLLVSTWTHIRRGHRHSCWRPSRPAVHLRFRGRARWVEGRRWRLSRRRHSPKRRPFIFS